MRAGTALRVAALLLLGCATPARLMWTHPSNTVADFRRDTYACTQESRVSWSGGGGGLLGLSLMASMQRQAQDQSDALYSLCMKSRGYTGRPMQPGETPAD